MIGRYIATFECQFPLTIHEIPPEGKAMHKTIIHVKFIILYLVINFSCVKGEWNFQLSGGSLNFKCYDKNPVYAVQLKQASELMLRTRILEETRMNGQIVTDPKQFQNSANVAVFPMPFSFPPQQGTLNLKSVKKPILSTLDGNYTNNMSTLVTDKVAKGSINLFIHFLIENTQSWNLCRHTFNFSCSKIR